MNVKFLPYRRRALDRKNTSVLFVLLLCSLFGLDRAAAQQPALSLDNALRIAREGNPGLQAARLRADASLQRVAPAGALPDPMLSFGLVNRPATNPANTDQPMTMNSVQLTQRFPWPGKLRYGAERARFLALAQSLDADETELRLEARVKEAYFQIAFIDLSLGIMGGTRDLLRNFRDVSSALFSVGTGLQQDVLQAQVTVARMTENITVAGQTRVALAARLNALLGRWPSNPIGATFLPAIDGELPTLEDLMRMATDARPALQAAQQRVEAAKAGYRAAARAVYPDITVTLGYANRPQFVDFSTLRIGLRLPIFAGSRYAPLRREMSALRQAADAQVSDIYNQTFAQLAGLRAEAVRANNLADLYTTSVLPQARAAVESALSAYQVGRVDYMTLVTSEMTVNRYEIESVRLQADYLRAVAQIEALVGSSNGEGL